MPVIPGVATATEVIAALDHGLDLLKFFPAEAAGGVAALTALAAPFPGVRFIPTGGISAANAARYLALPSVAAVGGSWMVAPDADRRSATSRRSTRLAARGGRARRGGSAMSGLAIRPAEECRYDLVALGEVMLRLDPGEGRIRTARSFRGLGRRRRVQRRPRAAPLLRPAHRGRHRLRRQRGRPAARGLHPAGRRRHLARPLGAVRRHRPHRPQRAQLHRARVRRARRARRVRPGQHRGVAAAAGRRRLGAPLRHARRALVPHRRDLRRRSPRRRPTWSRRPSTAAARHGTVVSYDLNYRPSLWKAIGGVERAQRGQPPAGAARRRDDRQRGGLHRLPRASRSRASTRTCAELDTAGVPAR